jgi:transcriptional regulator with XRE-family HTH domain
VFELDTNTSIKVQDCEVLRLRSIRLQQRMTLRALNAATGVAMSNLQKLESGVGDPQLSTLRKLAKALQVSVGELIDETQSGKGVKMHERKSSRTKR